MAGDNSPGSRLDQLAITGKPYATIHIVTALRRQPPRRRPSSTLAQRGQPSRLERRGVTADRKRAMSDGGLDGSVLANELLSDRAVEQPHTDRPNLLGFEDADVDAHAQRLATRQGPPVGDATTGEATHKGE